MVVFIIWAYFAYSNIFYAETCVVVFFIAEDPLPSTNRMCCVKDGHLIPVRAIRGGLWALVRTLGLYPEGHGEPGECLEQENDMVSWLPWKSSVRPGVGIRISQKAC